MKKKTMRSNLASSSSTNSITSKLNSVLASSNSRDDSICGISVKDDELNNNVSSSSSSSSSSSNNLNYHKSYPKYSENHLIVQQKSPPKAKSKNSLSSISMVHNHLDKTTNVAVEAKEITAFSTPARRRRIIAEFTKKTLKNYCITACINVKRMRLERIKAIIIQCAYRCYRSKRRLKTIIFLRRTKAVIVIQMLWRRFYSKKELKWRRAAYRLKLATNLARVCQRRWREINKRKMLRIKIIAYRLKILKIKNASALTIQRVTRGVFGRVKAKLQFIKNKKQQDKLWKIKNLSAIKIQCMFRKFKSIRIVYYIKKKFFSSYIINKNVNIWWHKRKMLRQKNSIIIQKYWRRYSSAIFVIRLRIRLAEELENARLLALSLIPLKISTPLKPEIKSMEIRVAVNLKLLQHMASIGPSEVITWCLQNFILHYSFNKGYSLGTVLNQVVNTVDNILPSFKQSELTELSTPNNDNSSIDNEINTKEKLIKLEKWDEGVKSDIPSSINLPERWNQILNFESGSSILTEIKSQSIQLQITVRDGDDNDQESDGLCLDSDEYSKKKIKKNTNESLSLDHDNLSQALSCFTPKRSFNSLLPRFLHVSLVLEGEIESGKPKPCIIPAQGIKRNLNDFSNDSFNNNNNNNNNNNLSDCDSVLKSDVRFLFKNALVLVPVQSLLPPPPDKKEILVGFDDSFDNISEDNESDSSDEIEVKTQVESSRPLTARIRFTMQDPEPEIIPIHVIDYDLFALKIQICCRKRLSLKSKAAWTLQHFFKKCIIMKKWKKNVYLMINRLNKSILIIQMKFRSYKAKDVVHLLRLQINSLLLNSVFSEISNRLTPETWFSDDDDDGDNNNNNHNTNKDNKISDVDKLLKRNKDELKENINENISKDKNEISIIKKKKKKKKLKSLKDEDDDDDNDAAADDDDDDASIDILTTISKKNNSNLNKPNDLMNKLLTNYSGLINLPCDSDILEHFQQFNKDNNIEAFYFQEGCSWGTEILSILDLNELNSPNCINLDDSLIYIELIQEELIQEEKKKEIVNLTKEEIMALIIAENNNDYKHETKIQEQSIEKKDKIVKLGYGDVITTDSNYDDLIIKIVKISIHNNKLNPLNGYNNINNSKHFNINIEYKEVKQNISTKDEKDFNLNDIFVDEDSFEGDYSNSLKYPLLYSNIAQMFP